MMNITWSWDEPEENERKDEVDYPECLADDLLQAEQEMQALDAKLDPDGLDKEGQQAWNAYEQGIEPVGLDYYVFDLKQGEKVIDQMTFKCSSEQEAYLRAEEAMVDGQECELVEIEPAI